MVQHLICLALILALLLPAPAAVTATPATTQFIFPEPEATSRLLARSRTTFKAYQNRGSLMIRNAGASSADIFINGRRLDAAAVFASPDTAVVFDISDYTVNGVNTLKAVNLTPAGSHIVIQIPYPELARGEPEAAGFSAAKLAEIDKLIDREVKAGFPGAVLLIVKDGLIIKETAYGWRQLYDGVSRLDKPPAMTTDTLFDLASNTKAFAVNLALQKLVSEGAVRLDAAVSDYLPDFRGNSRETITLRQLLTHSAGFAPEVRFFDPVQKASGLYARDPASTRALLSRIPLAYRPGEKAVYSDTNYIILGFIIETVSGQPLDRYVETKIYQPLGLWHILFNPLQKGFRPNQFAATERLGNSRDGRVGFPGIRRHTLRGEVHDEKAFYSLGGVSGHAGLFARAYDLAVLAQTLLNGGGYSGYRLCDEATLQQFTKPSDSDLHYGLGWDKNNIWQFGPYASPQTIGHTGWTGTAVTIDPAHDLAIILLTNKIHAPVAAERDHFTTAGFETGKYGSIMSLVYEAFLENRR
ncbi:MAG: penicillin binding protein PBP4B [Sporomusaceae bacterium]|nr:penicillin binding protein PBP4B [Sporomusaceae bacterium]